MLKTNEFQDVLLAEVFAEWYNTFAKIKTATTGQLSVFNDSDFIFVDPEKLRKHDNILENIINSELLSTDPFLIQQAPQYGFANLTNNLLLLSGFADPNDLNPKTGFTYSGYRRLNIGGLNNDNLTDEFDSLSDGVFLESVLVGSNFAKIKLNVKNDDTWKGFLRLSIGLFVNTDYGLTSRIQNQFEHLIPDSITPLTNPNEYLIGLRNKTRFPIIVGDRFQRVLLTGLSSINFPDIGIFYIGTPFMRPFALVNENYSIGYGDEIEIRLGELSGARNGNSDVPIIGGYKFLKFQDKNTIYTNSDGYNPANAYTNLIKIKLDQPLIDELKKDDYIFRYDLFSPNNLRIRRPLEIGIDFRIPQLGQFSPNVLNFEYQLKINDLARMGPFETLVSNNGQILITQQLSIHDMRNKYYIGRIFQWDGTKWNYKPDKIDPTIIERWGRLKVGDYYHSDLLKAFKAVALSAKTTTMSVGFNGVGIVIDSVNGNHPDHYEFKLPVNSRFTCSIDIFKAIKNQPYPNLVFYQNKSLTQGETILLPYIPNVEWKGRLNWHFPQFFN